MGPQIAAVVVVVKTVVVSTWLGTAVLAQEPLLRSEGGLNSRMGHSVSTIRDVNGDGHDDFLAGTYARDVVRVLSGLDGLMLYEVFGAGSFGRAVSALGDVDSDGISDFAVGAPQGARNDGMVYVLSGRDGSQIHVLQGDQYFSYLGIHLSGAGDVNLDGVPDVVCGGLNADGGARVFSGADGSLLLELSEGTETYSDYTRVASLGDVNGDGHGDIIVGSPDELFRSSRGLAWVFSGRDGSVLYRYQGPSRGSQFGSSVASIGDIDGDARPDFIIGAPVAGRNTQGRVTLYSGRDGSLITSRFGDASHDFFGASVSGGADVNGDGYPDFAVGATGADLPSVSASDVGQVKLFSGKNQLLLYRFTGEVAMSNFGTAVSLATDINGDGFSDLVVGAPGWESGGNRQGRVSVFSGNDLYLEVDPKLPDVSDQIQVSTRSGTPGQPTLLIVKSVNTVPIHLPVGGVGFFDARGWRELSAVVRPSASGFRFTLFALGLDAGGKLVQSANEVVEVQ